MLNKNVVINVNFTSLARNLKNTSNSCISHQMRQERKNNR